MAGGKETIGVKYSESTEIQSKNITQHVVAEAWMQRDKTNSTDEFPLPVVKA